MTVAKYKGMDPGRLSCRVWHSGPSLHVALGQAWLGGKRSQDPYALVYLLWYYFVPHLSSVLTNLHFAAPPQAEVTSRWATGGRGRLIRTLSPASTRTLFSR